MGLLKVSPKRRSKLNAQPASNRRENQRAQTRAEESPSLKAEQKRLPVPKENYPRPKRNKEKVDQHTGRQTHTHRERERERGRQREGLQKALPTRHSSKFNPVMSRAVPTTTAGRNPARSKEPPKRTETRGERERERENAESLA